VYQPRAIFIVKSELSVAATPHVIAYLLEISIYFALTKNFGYGEIQVVLSVMNRQNSGSAGKTNLLYLSSLFEVHTLHIRNFYRQQIT